MHSPDISRVTGYDTVGLFSKILSVAAVGLTTPSTNATPHRSIGAMNSCLQWVPKDLIVATLLAANTPVFYYLFLIVKV